MLPGIVDSKWNPDGLPVGMTRLDVAEGRWQGAWVGLNCAACHNGELQYQGRRIRIDGGVNQALDMRALIGGLVDALQGSLSDVDKFERLAIVWDTQAMQPRGRCVQTSRSRSRRLAPEQATRGLWFVEQIGARTSS